MCGALRLDERVQFDRFVVTSLVDMVLMYERVYRILSAVDEPAQQVQSTSR